MVKMKKRLNNRQLIIISTLVGVIIFTLETVIDLLVGGYINCLYNSWKHSLGCDLGIFNVQTCEAKTDEKGEYT